MGLKLNRNKKRTFLLTLIYRIDKIIFLKNKTKLKLYLNLEWIFNRLVHEYSFNIYSKETHPFRIFSKEFLFKNINSNDRVLDLGCKYGDVSKIVAMRAKNVVGIDYNAAAIAIAKENFKNVENIEFINSEGYAYLENNKEPFDVLILSHVVEHLDNPADFLKKFSPFFKKIFIEVPDFDASYLNHYRKDLDLTLNYTDSDHVFEFDRDELMEVINTCNLVVDFAEYKYGHQKLWLSHKN